MSEHAHCGLCGCATTNTGTKRCDGCWELERRTGEHQLEKLAGCDGGRKFLYELSSSIQSALRKHGRNKA